LFKVLGGYFRVSERRGVNEKQVRYLNDLLDNMNEVFYTYDLEGRLNYVNKKCLETIGYQPEEILGRYGWDFIPERYRDIFRDATIERLKNQPIQATYVVTVQRKDGSERILRLNASPITDGDAVIGEMVLAEDETERRQAEKALKQNNLLMQMMQEELTAANQQLKAAEEELIQQLDEAENNKLALASAHQKMEAIFNFLPDPTFFVNADGVVTMWNRAIEDLTGVKVREILGKGNREYSRVFYGNRRPMLIDLALEGREVDMDEEIIVIRHGERVLETESVMPNNGDNLQYLNGKSSPLYDHNGILLGAIESLRDTTESKRAQWALQQSEEKYRGILESIEDGYFEVDHLGRMQFFNPHLIHVLGYEPDELLGSSYRVLMDEENSSKLFEAFNKVYTTGQPVKELDWQVPRKDGSKLFVETTVLPIKEDNRVVGFRGIIHDISERKAAQEALARSESLYRTIFETTGTAMIIIDDDRTISLMNTETERLLGYTKEEIEGKIKWDSVVAPDDLERMTDYHTLRRMYAGQAPRSYEFKLISKFGQIHDVVLTIAMIPDSNKSVASIQDITDRKRADEALQLSEARYRAIVEDQTELICRYLPDGTIIFVNETYCRYFGGSREEIIGGNFVEVFAAQDREMINQQIHDLSRLNPVTNGEVILHLPGGQERWLSWTHRAIFNEHGVLLDYQSVGRDVTARKQAEERLRYLSIHDALTGLYNRLYFQEKMKVMDSAEYTGVGLIMADVDGLKIVNDTLGHDRGDKLLRGAASLLVDCFRKGDIVARVGGDEFAILIPFTSKQEMDQAIERIRNKIKAYNETYPEMHLSISLGYAIKENPASNISSIFEEADNNMYHDKLRSKLSTRGAIIQTLIKALETKDFMTEGHGERMENLVMKMANALELPERTVNELKLLARFHDIGKVGVDDGILFKKGPLDPEELQQMHRHCEIGNRIAFSAPELVLVADWILKHHEWWNGEGYPLGLIGDDIPLECRILAIADAYDAMTSNRPYRGMMTHEKVIAELQRGAGTQFDPLLVEKFIQLL